MPRASASPGARLALWAIRRYQHHLSPHKGFACAWRLAHGGAGCSGHGLRVIGRHGLLRGLALLNRRLTRCAEARRTNAPATNPLLHRQRGECDPGCDCGAPSGRSCLPQLWDMLGCGCDIGDKWRKTQKPPPRRR